METSANDWEILYWDGNTITQITNNLVADIILLFQWERLHGSNYPSNEMNNDEIFYWDGNTIIQVTENNTWDSSPSLYKNTIAWSGDVNGKEIYYVTIE